MCIVQGHSKCLNAVAVSYVLDSEPCSEAAVTSAATALLLLCQLVQTMRLLFWLQESSITYNAAIAATGEALMQAASCVLNQQSQQELDFEGDLDEFGQRLCETMADFGSTHLHCLTSRESKILFLQQVGMPGFPIQQGLTDQ